MKSSLFIFLLLCTSILSSFCYALETNQKHIENPAIQAIDAEIEKLTKQLDEYRLREANEQVEAQDYMIANWPQYARDIEEVEQYDETGNQIEKRLQELKQLKQELLKNSKRTKNPQNDRKQSCN